MCYLTREYTYLLAQDFFYKRIAFLKEQTALSTIKAKHFLHEV